MRAQVREALLAGGLGRTDPAAPLKDLIPEGGSVLLKPNWVHHANPSRSGTDCLVTHPSVIEAALEEVCAARPSRVILGDAPVQSCIWEELVTPQRLRRWQEVAARGGVALEVVDFRRSIVPTGQMEGGVLTDLRPLERYALFDLGKHSLLEPISTSRGDFRVGDYDHRLLSRTHHRGVHQYLLAREPFEVDVVLSLPKLKTHRKAGLTGALKNLVGLNGNKDYLPHHRVGGSALGGDNFPGASPTRHLAEWVQDLANQRIGSAAYPWLRRVARGLRGLSGGGGKMGGAWHGNDTTWRMTLDLNRCLLYGRADGTMADTPQRRIYSLTDAIIAGQGEGPLKPAPHPLGAVTFASSSVAAEVVHAHLMGLDPDRLALIRRSREGFRWSLAPDEIVLWSEGRQWSIEEAFPRWGRAARPAAGWAGNIELGGAS